MPDQKGYDTPKEAVIAALKEAIPKSSQFEHAGALYEKDGKFFFTEPKSNGENDSVKVKVRFPKGAKLVALYHTHPDGRRSEVFSPNDIAIATQLDIPYFMGHVNGTVRVFKPGVSEVTKMRGRRLRAPVISEGLLVGDISETKGLLSPSLPGPFSGLLGPPR